MCKQIKSPLMGKKEEGRELHNRLKTIYIYIYIFTRLIWNMRENRNGRKRAKRIPGWGRERRSWRRRPTWRRLWRLQVGHDEALLVNAPFFFFHLTTILNSERCDQRNPTLAYFQFFVFYSKTNVAEFPPFFFFFGMWSKEVELPSLLFYSFFFYF